MAYLLDANFFITAHRAHYPFDVVPSFWNKVKELAGQGIIRSLDKVGAEIRKGNDHLKDWADAELPADFFEDSSRHIVAYSRIAQWAAERAFHYSPGAINEFLDADEADAWLIAAASELGNTIVTHEISNPRMKSRIAIPEPCDHFSIQFCNPIQMFRQLGVRF
ncbi:DUF4411 family protein [Taibaiella soli]|uniref:DUF4411 domain-containing protein n=1 Tax=Taibaiella soli TaxID=1649169 RepID=A0A2W2ABE5_9BACT|nr:DUF4411 family protein [Taibaiella soli]PZF72631.1 DUF4411 domain-containing protein [Taibaiella soli]